MEAQRNLTVRLPESVIHKARVIAARRGTSISGLVTASIESLAAEQDVYDVAMKAAFSLMDQGALLDGPPWLSREEAHER